MASPNPLKNYLASFRLPNMIPFGMFASGQDLSWIAGAGLAGQFATVVGSIDGENNVFTLSVQPNNGVSISRNGNLVEQGTMFTISASTVTFLYPYIPQPGDWLTAYVF